MRFVGFRFRRGGGGVSVWLSDCERKNENTKNIEKTYNSEYNAIAA